MSKICDFWTLADIDIVCIDNLLSSESLDTCESHVWLMQMPLGIGCLEADAPSPVPVLNQGGHIACVSACILIGPGSGSFNCRHTVIWKQPVNPKTSLPTARLLYESNSLIAGWSHLTFKNRIGDLGAASRSGGVLNLPLHFANLCPPDVAPLCSRRLRLRPPPSGHQPREPEVVQGGRAHERPMGHGSGHWHPVH